MAEHPLFALRATLPRRTESMLGLASVLLLFGVWALLSYGELVSASFLPTPTGVVRGLLQLFFQRDLMDAVLTSLRRVTLAFALASAVAVPLGVLMGSYEVINRFFDPVLAPLRFMPISAFIPLLIVWFGIDEGEKIAFLFLGVFVYLLPVVVGAIRGVPQEYVDTARTLGANRTMTILTVLLPAALPQIFDSFRVMNAIAWTYVILAEAVNPGNSLGYLIQLAYTHSNPEWSFAGLIVIGGVGLVSDGVLRALSALLFRWRESDG